MMITVDFETHAILPRPEYPPVPVGVAVEDRYLAWGHPTENNCTKAQAQGYLAALWENNELLFHNAKFDLDVANVHLGLPIPRWENVHDTMLLAFLDDPHTPTLALKPLSERLLHLPSEERDEVKDWVLANVPEARRSKKTWGAHIAQAPGDLVGRYAIGDVRRTRALFEHLKESQGAAYDRERQLLFVLLDMERRGVRIDRERLERDVAIWQASVEQADQWVRERLGVPGLELDSNEDLADALENAGVLDEWVLTDKGQRSTAKEALALVVKDETLLSVLDYRARLCNSLRTFGLPWSVSAKSTSRIWTQWNQIRNEFGGARTGRLSSSPNFQNVLKSPSSLPLPLPSCVPLPHLRSYILPDAPGEVILDRDYSQQEYRILAHFEDGELLARYRADPHLDMHTVIQGMLAEHLGYEIPRRQVKTLNFGVLYGMGLGKLSAALGVDEAEAKKFRTAYFQAVPGVRELDTLLKNRGKCGAHITTWGGRRYYVEPPTLGRTYEYKLLNVLIQGSAADCTKQAMINYRGAGRLILTLHDELVVSCPAEVKVQEMERLREAMESVSFDVAMVSDGKWSPTSWGELEEWNANTEA